MHIAETYTENADTSCNLDKAQELGYTRTGYHRQRIGSYSHDSYSQGPCTTNNISTCFTDLGAKNMAIQQALMKDYLQLQNH